MSRLLLRKQRLIGRIAPDSGRIVEFRGFSGFQQGTLAASHRRAVSASLSSRRALGLARPLVSWRAPAVSGTRPGRCRLPRFADPPLIVRMTRSLRGADLPEASRYMATPLR